jgi:signal transduction histidine kinase
MDAVLTDLLLAADAVGNRADDFLATAVYGHRSRALVALLDNAVRHSPPGGTVTESARSTGRDVEVRVADRGAGIQGIVADRLFDRFVRTDDTVRRDFGLGLALVRDIAARFGGDVTVDRTSTEGTTFLLTLPAVRHP